MILSHIKKNVLVDIFFAFQIVISIIFFVTGLPLLLYLFLCFLPFNLIIMFLKGVELKSIFIVGVLFLIILLFGFNNNYSENLWLPSLVLSFNCFLISCQFYSDSARKYMFFIVFILNIYVFFVGFVNGFSLDFGEMIFFERSRNIVSAVLILFFIHYMLLSHIHNKKVNIFLAGFLLLNCFILFGRTGIVISSILFLSVVYKVYSKFLFYIILMFVSAIVAVYNTFLYEYFKNKTNFASGLDSPRADLFSEYFYNISGSDLMFGRNIFDCCSQIVLMGNPHNSFILGHMYYGLGYVLLLLLILIIIVFSKNLYIIFLFSLVFFRYSLDSIGLFYIVDFALYFLIYFAYKKGDLRFRLDGV
ncbi:hypothetical protein [Acinetobacter towneri]|uniref:hypothetical protein n=1 Tax=Acinetobacter towneri TaxID=202956 RepID=UPI003A8C3DD8